MPLPPALFSQLHLRVAVPGRAALVRPRSARHHVASDSRLESKGSVFFKRKFSFTCLGGLPHCQQLSLPQHVILVLAEPCSRCVEIHGRTVGARTSLFLSVPLAVAKATGVYPATFRERVVPAEKPANPLFSLLCSRTVSRQTRGCPLVRRVIPPPQRL